MRSQTIAGPKHNGEVIDLEFSPDGKWLVSVGETAPRAPLNRIWRAKIFRYTQAIGWKMLHLARTVHGS